MSIRVDSWLEKFYAEICREFSVPGWVPTDMGGQGATRSVEEGADTIVWLAADAPQKLTGNSYGTGKRFRGEELKELQS